MKRKSSVFCCILALLLSSTGSAFPGEKLMIKGYDPVAYFNTGKPVKGLKDFEYQWMSAIFRFSSQENLELFRKDPDRYAPQYGGYCLYAVNKGYTAAVDTEAWDIREGKVVFKFNKKVN